MMIAKLKEGKDMLTPQLVDESGDTPTEAVEVTAKLQRIGNKVKVYEVVILRGGYRDGVRVYIAKVAASGKRKAREVARKVFTNLTPKQMESAVAEVSVGDDVDIVTVRKSRNRIQGHIWIQADSDTDALDRLVERAAAEMLADELAAMSS